MSNMEVFFSSDDMTWTTPLDFFKKLDFEFNFTLDPCCFKETAKCENYFTPVEDGLAQEWAPHITFCNPPYGSEIGVWMRKAYHEACKGAIVVCLIPARTDTKYWHEYCMKASEIRFVKGRLKFGSNTNSAPFPSSVVIFNYYNWNGILKINPYNKDLKSPISFGPLPILKFY